METVARPWLALWSLVAGFFMILIDTTIVFVANPSIGKALDADITAVVWVTSAYLLSYQEGQTYKWGTLDGGPFTVWGLIIAGVVVMAIFIRWQWWLERRGGEPSLPLGLFQDRNFALGNAGITVVGFSITAYPLASMIFYQVALGLTPTQSALLLIPMAVFTGALSPIVGKLIDRVNPRWFAVAGMLLFTLAIYWTSVLMTPDAPVWMFLLPSAVQGLGMGCIFGPIANATTRNLAPRQAGAGSGVFNTSRQIGSVLGAAAMAALIQARIVAESLGMVLKRKSPRPAELQFSPGARWSGCRRRTGQAGAPRPPPRYC